MHNTYGNYRARKSQEQQTVQDNSWKNHVYLILFLLGKQAKGQETVDAVMTKEEAQAIWEDIDNYRYGYIGSNNIQRWLQETADFNLPFDDLHWLYNCFQVSELDGRIVESQFFKIMCGPQELKEEPETGDAQQQEDEDH